MGPKKLGLNEEGSDRDIEKVLRVLQALDIRVFSHQDKPLMLSPHLQRLSSALATTVILAPALLEKRSGLHVLMRQR